MNDAATVIRLQAWLSPSFPTGAFSYSSGLESAVEAGVVLGFEDLHEWITSQLNDGPLWNDAVLLAESWKSENEGKNLDVVNQLALALSFSAQRHLETIAQGSAFLKAAVAWGGAPNLDEDCALPVAVGAVCGFHKIDLEVSTSAFLHAAISNQIQAGLRLIKIGQQRGVKLLAKLEKDVLSTAQRASVSSLEDLRSSTFMLDIIAMQHESLRSRIFRT